MTDEKPKKRGRGRPKKVVNAAFDPHDPVATLKALAYDPIAETIKSIKDVESRMRWCKKQSRPSQAAIAALMATKRALNADLLKFGFRPIPEKIIQENHNFSFGIQLTDHDGTAVEAKDGKPKRLEPSEETRH